jgi:hypothetical protein
MLRLILAVAAGFVTMSVLVLATEFALLTLLFPTVEILGGPLPPAYLLAYGASSLFYAVIGGCVAASIGRKYEAPTILGALMLGIAIGGAVMNRGNQPIWFAATVPLLGAVVTTISGYAWLRRR